MSAICICGVCVPYSAIIPLLLVVLQYIARPLYQMGLIPDGLAKKLGITIHTDSGGGGGGTDGNKCCDSDAASVGVAGRMESTVSNDTTTTTTTTTTNSDNDNDITDITAEPTATILEISSKDELTLFMNQQKETIVILKFTAEWCKPCKAIHPFYQQLALQHHIMNTAKGKDNDSTITGTSTNTSKKVRFATVDVDEVDQLADQYKIAMMPTFIAFRNHVVLQRISGSSEAKLEAFVQQVLI
jgi:thiol-disulfide isomerase/thioredoxin